MSTILVVDDEALTAEAVAFVLSESGYTVVIASDGTEALDRLKGTHISLIVTDFMMPFMTGLELARAVRASADLGQLPIVLLSAAQASIGMQHPELFSAVFEKPCDPVHLIAAIESLLISTNSPEIPTS